MQQDQGSDHREERPPDRLLRIEEVMALCGLSRSGVNVAMKEMNFPRPIKVGRRAVRWRLWEVLDWIDSRERSEGEIGRGRY